MWNSIKRAMLPATGAILAAVLNKGANPRGKFLRGAHACISPAPEKARRTLALSLILIQCLLVSKSGAQTGIDDYPARPVTIVIPYAGTSGLDNEMRLYNQSILQATGKQFINDAKGGAGTTIGSAYVAKASPDGYTLLAQNSPFTISPIAYPNLPYDNVRDFIPVSLLSEGSYLILSSTSVPFKAIGDMLAYARANPGKLNWSTNGVGSAGHLVGEWLAHATRTRYTFVHYKTSSQRLIDVIGGRVELTSASLAATVGSLKSGKMRLLGVTTRSRLAALPDEATVAEQGVPGFAFAIWVGLLAPARTSAPIISKLNAMFVKATKDPAVTKKLEADGSILIGSTPEQFRDYLANDYRQVRKLVTDAGIKLEAE